VSTTEQIRQDAEALAIRAETRIKELEVLRAEAWEEIQELRQYTRKPAKTTKAVRSNGHVPKHMLPPSPNTVHQTAATIYENFLHDPFTRKGVAEKSGLHPTTVGKVFDELLKQEAIYPAEVLRINGAPRGTQHFRVQEGGRQTLMDIASRPVL